MCSNTDEIDSHHGEDVECPTKGGWLVMGGHMRVLRREWVGVGNGGYKTGWRRQFVRREGAICMVISCGCNMATWQHHCGVLGHHGVAG